MSHKAAPGFTLVEVVVALLVLGTALTALQLNIGGQLDASAHLEEKTVAQWVALNQLERLRLENRLGGLLPERDSSGVTDMARRRWYWRVSVQPLEQNSLVVPVRVEVAREPGLAPPMVSLEGVLDAYYSL